MINLLMINLFDSIINSIDVLIAIISINKLIVIRINNEKINQINELIICNSIVNKKNLHEFVNKLSMMFVRANASKKKIEN